MSAVSFALRFDALHEAAIARTRLEDFGGTDDRCTAALGFALSGGRRRDPTRQYFAHDLRLAREQSEAADPDEVAQQGLDYLGREPIGTIGRLDQALAAATRASLGSR